MATRWNRPSSFLMFLNRGATFPIGPNHASPSPLSTFWRAATSSVLVSISAVMRSRLKRLRKDAYDKSRGAYTLFSSQIANRFDLFARQDVEVGVEHFGDIVDPVFEI